MKASRIYSKRNRGSVKNTEEEGDDSISDANQLDGSETPLTDSLSPNSQPIISTESFIQPALNLHISTSNLTMGTPSRAKQSATAIYSDVCLHPTTSQLPTLQSATLHTDIPGTQVQYSHGSQFISHVSCLKFSLYYQNSSSISNKSSTMLCNTTTSEYDIILIAETWLKEDRFSAEYLDLNLFNVVRCDRKDA